MRKILNLDDCPAILVFREVARILQADPTLAGIVRADAWSIWDGEANSNGSLPPSGDVAVRLSPSVTGERWYSPDETIRELQINVDFDVQSTCINDPHNFWQAVQRAFYPPDDPTLDNPTLPRETIRQALASGSQKEAGRRWMARTGVLMFTGPLVIPVDKAEVPFFSCRGVLKLQIDNPLNT